MAHNSRDSLYKPGFAIVPRELIRDSSLSANAIRLYGVLATYTDGDGWGAFPGQQRLAEDMGCSKPTVQRALYELEKALWVFVERTRNKGGNWMSNKYVLAHERGSKPRRRK